MQDTFRIIPSNHFIDLDLYQVGMEHCEPGHSFGPASRNHYLFHYVLSGRGTLHCKDSKGVEQHYKVEANEGFMLMPGHIAFYVADERFPWHYMWLEFDGLRSHESLHLAGFSIDRPIYRSSQTELREAMKQEMISIIENENASLTAQIGHLFLFMDYLTRSMTNRAPSIKNKLRYYYVQEAISFIEENYDKEVSVEEIANNCGINRCYFGKIFKEEIGSTPQQFLLNYRMVKSTELLQRTDMPIADISALVGYPNQLHFSRAFKKIYGIPPREWRNRNRFSLPGSDATDKPHTASDSSEAADLRS